MKRRPLINNKKLLLKQVMNDYTTASEMFCKKSVSENFAKFTRKHLRQCLHFSKVAGLQLY